MAPAGGGRHSRWVPLRSWPCAPSRLTRLTQLFILVSTT